jgi:nicotinate-nucleotide adenylyltransferase
VNSVERVGYFGGTFDPPHLGHEILAREASYQLGLNHLYWLLTPDPPHKYSNQITAADDRLEMLGLVVERYQGFEISHLDLDRPAPHYASDTVEIIKKKNPEIELIYIIGEDSLRDLPDWYEPQRFLAAVDILAVAPRLGINTDLDHLDGILPGISSKTRFLKGVMVEISSSLIRQRSQEGGPFRHFLTREVGDYLEDKPLYLNRDNET